MHFLLFLHRYCNGEDDDEILFLIKAEEQQFWGKGNNYRTTAFDGGMNQTDHQGSIVFLYGDTTLLHMLKDHLIHAFHMREEIGEWLEEIEG